MVLFACVISITLFQPVWTALSSVFSVTAVHNSVGNKNVIKMQRHPRPMGSGFVCHRRPVFNPHRLAMPLIAQFFPLGPSVAPDACILIDRPV
jgi:hypothetical protein